MLTRVYLSTATVSKEMDGLDPQVNASALEHALDTQCSESEESSDDSCSSDGSASDDDEEYEAPSSTGPRRPSLSLNTPSDRRASAPSQRSPLSINLARSLSSFQFGAPSPSPRTPSMSMRHDAALRSFHQKCDQETQSLAKSAKPRPAMMNIASISTVPPPRIEIEQVFDDEEEEVESARREVETAKADRSAARSRMLTALGRGQSNTTATSTQPARRSGSSRRVPSLDQISNMYHAKAGMDEIKTPAPKTPGTASPFHHQRNASCPTPTSPYTQQYGEVQVIITPPTPRPQGPGSPALGVYINGLHGNNGFHPFADNDHLIPPAFELAAGKQLAKQERESGALAWMATLQAQQLQMEELCRQQQQVLLSSMQQALPSCYDVLAGNGAGLGLMQSFPSPSIVPGTPGAPSMIHIQQQRAMLAQQRAIQEYYLAAALASPPKQQARNSASPKSNSRPNSAKQQTLASTTKSWWRSNAPDSSASIDGPSSGSLYSKSSASSSPASSSPAWRRKGVDTGDSLEKPKSAVYVPPAKRAAILKQQQQQQQQQAAIRV